MFDYTALTAERTSLSIVRLCNRLRCIIPSDTAGACGLPLRYREHYAHSWYYRSVQEDHHKIHAIPRILEVHGESLRSGRNSDARLADHEILNNPLRYATKFDVTDAENGRILSATSA